jgi:hypothetical protein
MLLAVGVCLGGRLRRSDCVGAHQVAGEFTITGKDYRFTPDRVEAIRDDLIELTVISSDVAYGFHRQAPRVEAIPAGGSLTFDWADQAGTFEFYSNLTNDPSYGHAGSLVVRPK